MKKALRKDFFMDIKKSFARFISIFFIVALGVAFFSGIQAASPDMRYSGDSYYDETNLMDLRVMGTLGLTDEDMEALNQVKGVELAEGGYALDVLSGEKGSQQVIHLESLGGSINKLSVIDGRMPEKKGECLIDSQLAGQGAFQMGSEVVFETEDDEDSVLKQKSYTIVGTCSSPMYISFARGHTTLGSGEVSGYAYVTEDNFDQEVYTVAYLLAKGAREQVSYTELYENLVKKVQSRVEGIKEERCQLRYDSVRGKARQELADGEKELADGKKKARRELEDAKKELSDARKKLEDGRAEYEDGVRQLSDAKQKLSDGRRQLSDGRLQQQNGTAQLEAARNTLNSQQAHLDSSQAQTDQGYAQWNASKQEFDQKEQEYNSGAAQYEQGAAALAQAKQQLAQQKNAYAQLEAAGMGDEQTRLQLEAAEAQLAQQEQALEASRTQLAQAKVQLDNGRRELEAAKNQLDDAQAQIDSGVSQLSSARAQLDSQQASLNAAAEEINRQEVQLSNAERQIAENEQKLKDAKEEIEKNEKKLKDGEADYKKARKEVKKELADGEAEIADAREKIASIEKPKWYVDDRSVLPEHSDYGDNADRIRNIGRVFPVLFFLVAALISLTTMTRMVEEERTLIGTLKALGYGKGAIAAKYLGYALLATLSGSIFGVLIGQKILPYIIITAYRIMYHQMPTVEIPYQVRYAMIGSVAAVACTLLATFSACRKELMETPASLMRPAAPKEGKRVLLERIPFLWKHLNFTWKSTVRNLFRYKKRFFMTIIGIGGCTALMLVGFGLQDSIMDIGALQYGQLQHFEATVLQDEDASQEEKAQLKELLETDHRVEKSVQVYFQNMTASGEKKRLDVYLIVPEKTERFSEMVTLRERLYGEEYRLEDVGVVISEKTAKLLDVKEGDSIELSVEDGVSGQVLIGRICENYMSHYMYMTPEAFLESFGEEPDCKDSLVIFQDEYQNRQEEIGRDILASPAALSISYTGSIADQLEKMLSSLDSVMVVLIVSAGMLAFVVLYNLNNINITERKRELATLKVLGFFDGEVSAYVYRENVLLTVIGAAVGSFLGILLHRFVIVTVEVDAAMFGRNIYWPSFVYSALFTLGFSAFVNMVMYFKLKKIDMVESLKSVE